MRSNTSININSMQFRGSSSRDLNFLSGMKVSQRLDSRLKSVMPQLKGKQSQTYLTIKIHKSLSDSKSDIIPQVKQQLYNLTNNHNHQQMVLGNFIQWVTFDQPKQLLREQYLDNQLYYIIVTEKLISWAEAFAKQERVGSDNNKRIHVLGVLRDDVYKEKLKGRAKKRIDKQQQYVHYYSVDNQESSMEICTLISEHLQLKLKHEDQHIKQWALSNKYAHKQVKRRTVHIYFDNDNRSALQSMYKKYNPKSKSSWLQIHPYSSFYDIVKSIKQRQALNIKEADKANQMAQELTSRLIKSRSQIDIVSMKSINNMFDNSQILTTSIQTGAKLNQDDVNVIISRTDFDEIDKLIAFVKAQKMKNWQLVQINEDSPNFNQKMAQIFQIGNNFQQEYQQQRQQRIIHSKTLYIIAQGNDDYTKEMFYRQDNIFHNMQLLLYNDLTEFAILLREGVKSKDNYTVAIVNAVDCEYQRQIKDFMKQYKNTEVIDNFMFISTANGVHAGFLSTLNQFEQGLSRICQLGNNDQGWLQRMLMERDNFFHPFRGLKGANVYLLIKSTKKYLLDDLRQYIGQSQRLHIATYIDKQYLAKQLQNIQIKDSAIVITDDQSLREAQEIIVKFDEVFIMNITKRRNLKQQVKVFAWGDKQKLYNLLKMIPEMDHKLQSQLYNQPTHKISLTRSNRYLPTSLNFLPGNTIAVRLPADLTDQQSRKMQMRLKKYFKEQIKIEYYKQPRDICLRDKAIQTMTFVILTQKELGCMKMIARGEVDEKRQEFILFDQDPEDYGQLIQKAQFDRFRLISNSWESIQDYIIRTFGIYHNLQPLREKLDNSIDRVLRDIQNVVDEMLVDQKQVKFKQNSKVPTKTDINPILIPVIDTAPYQSTEFIIQIQPDQGYPTLSTQPKRPLPQANRYHLAALYCDTHQFRSLVQMLKSNLEPEQFSVKIIPFKNQHQLQEFARGNKSKLSSFDKIIILLSPQYKRYDNILKSMKLKLGDTRMEYYFFDDHFYLINHHLLTKLLRPYKIRKVKLPWENPTLPKFWQEESMFNLFVPLSNRKYDSLKSKNVSVLSFSLKQEIQKYIHKAGYFNIIMCDKASYHVLKEFTKKSPRCILLVDENVELYEDELLFNRYPLYSIYYGSNGADYLKRTLPKNYSHPQKSPVKILYFSPTDIDLTANNPDYQKIEFNHNLQLYDHMTVKYGLIDYTHWLLRSSPITELIHLNPKVYLEDKSYMKDYKNNFAQKGYRHKVDVSVSMIKSQVRMHQFVDLHECFYKDHKHLIAMLKVELSPCVVLINESNNKLLGVKDKFCLRHKFVSIVDDSQRWIDKDGYLLQVQNFFLLKKQNLLLSLFTEKVFDSFNDFQYYYLSNKADVDRRFNIYFRTKEDLEEIYQRNGNLLMVVFVQSCDKKHIPAVLLEELHFLGSRVKIIYVQSQFVDDDVDLYVKFNEIDPVIYHINRIEFSGRRDYVVFRQVDGDKKRLEVIIQKNLQKVGTRSYKSMDDVDRIGDQLKGVYNKVFVICFPQEQQQIERIFGKYSIKNKKHSNEALEFFHIDSQFTTKNPNINITSQSHAKKTPTNYQQKHQSYETENYLNLIQNNPAENRQSLLDFGKTQSKSSQNDEDQITKLNLYSNIRSKDIQLFDDNEIEKVKRRLDGNLIVLIIEHSKKGELKDITNKYNVLVQNYTNALNLESGLRDHKDSVTIAVISKNMIQKVIPLKKKYNQTTFILEDETLQQELLQNHKSSITGQIRKISDLQKLLGKLFAENERIQNNGHSIQLASEFENKRPQISVDDYGSNERFSNAINNQKSKEIVKIGSISNYERMDSKFRSPQHQNYQVKKQKHKYQPNTFGTTPRFTGDFVPPKSMKESCRDMKSLSKSKEGRETNLKSKNIYYRK